MNHISIIGIRIMRMAILLSSVVLATSLGLKGADHLPRIDRHALVTRHNLDFAKSEPVQVGNGEFAFTADITGLAIFRAILHNVALGLALVAAAARARPSPISTGPPKMTHGRPVDYMVGTGDAISQWLFANPHRLNLGRIALRMTKADGKRAAHSRLEEHSPNPRSMERVAHQPIRVGRHAGASHDMLSSDVSTPWPCGSALAADCGGPFESGIGVSLPDLKIFGGYGDWSKPDAHETILTSPAVASVAICAKARCDEYHVSLAWSAGSLLAGQGADRHCFTLTPEAVDSLEFVCAFAPKPLPESLPSVADTVAACRAHWPAFWQSGGAIDLSGSKDSHAKELERRIVLSQYLMAVNEAGSQPPQESGLVNNGWNGNSTSRCIGGMRPITRCGIAGRFESKHRHLSKSTAVGREKAARQGYKGATWPKNTGPEGRESPHPIDAMLIWQQPHPIFFAELDYRAHPTPQTLEKWKEIIFDTADFMASFAALNPATGRYDLGPPMYTVPEITNCETAHNPAFELSYWQFGLRTAQTWRERLGLPRNPDWDKVLHNLAPLPQQDGVYIQEEGLPIRGRSGTGIIHR